jgi:hypothetical protein
MMLSRFNRMEPETSQNLDAFLQAYTREGRFALVPMMMTTNVTTSSFRFDLAIKKRKLELKRAWEIGPDDPDMSVLRNSDDPIVPDGVAGAPVIAALERLREMRASKSRLFGVDQDA